MTGSVKPSPRQLGWLAFSHSSSSPSCRTIPRVLRGRQCNVLCLAKQAFAANNVVEVGRLVSRKQTRVLGFIMKIPTLVHHINPKRPPDTCLSIDPPQTTYQPPHPRDNFTSMSKSSASAHPPSNTLLLRRQLAELKKRPLEGFSAGTCLHPWLHHRAR